MALPRRLAKTLQVGYHHLLANEIDPSKNASAVRQTPARAAPERATVVIEAPAKAGGKRRTLRFGSARVIAERPSKADIQSRVEESRLALAGLAARLIKPGVRIRKVKGVPLFYADPQHPDRLIRELDGKRESGAFRDGLFEVIE